MEEKLTRNQKAPITAEFPSNSNISREKPKKSEENTETPQKKKIKPIVKGKVLRKKKSLGKKIAEAFLGDENRSIGDYLIQDVLVPAAKSTLSELVGGGIDMWLFGERRNRGGYYNQNSRNRQHTSYGSYFGREKDDRGRNSSDRREVSRDTRSRHNFDDIVLESRGEGEEVLDHLVDLTIDYGVATVADYYELLDVESTYADQKYGWTNLKSADVVRVREGYSIRLPQPKPI